MLVLTNRLDPERHLPDIKEIARTHEIARTYLAAISPDFSPRIRSIVAPHRLDMVARMSQSATGDYLSRMAASLQEEGMDCQALGAGLPARTLDDFIAANKIGLIVAGDGRSGLCRWYTAGLSGRAAQLLSDQTFGGGNAPSSGRARTGDKKMLVLLDRLDVKKHLPQLKDMVKAHEVGSVHLARISNPAPAAPAAAQLSSIAGTLATEGVLTVPAGASLSAGGMAQYVENNQIDIIVSGDGRSGLSSWPRDGLNGRNLAAVFEEALYEGAPVESLKTAMNVLERLPLAVLQFSGLFVLWLVLSGKYKPEYIVTGIAAAALITYISNRAFPVADAGRQQFLPVLSQMWRFMAYLPKLFIRILLANLQVAYLVLHPKMPISPAFLRFQTHLQRSIAQVLLANSITLTPGTITVDLKDGEYVVHVLVPLSAYEIITGQMQNRVGAIFGEEREDLPHEISLCLSIGELEQ
ncbi:MAG: Na+/H+ antiporter subunit E [Chloroflexi bacterium]|nr:Na+/H+ antiporter subunit E [Chloroflexota bacterium]